MTNAARIRMPCAPSMPLRMPRCKARASAPSAADRAVSTAVWLRGPGTVAASAAGWPVARAQLATGRAHNPAKPSVLPRPPAAERTIWTLEEAARFLRHCHHTDPLMADFVEVLIGTGMRKGEALGLHWTDVHLDEQVLYVRYTLSAINNSRLVITTPKTRSSKNWVATSPRVATALTHQAPLTPAAPQPDDPFSGLVFR